MARLLIGSGLLVGIIGTAGAGYGDIILSAVHTAASGLFGISKNVAVSANRLGADADSAVNKQLERAISEMKDFVVRETARSQPQSIHIVTSSPGSKLFLLACCGGALVFVRAGYAVWRFCGVSFLTRGTLDAIAASLNEKINLIETRFTESYQSLKTILEQLRSETETKIDGLEKKLEELQDQGRQMETKVDKLDTGIAGLQDQGRQMGTKVDDLQKAMAELFEQGEQTQQTLLMAFRLLFGVMGEVMPQSKHSLELEQWAKNLITSSSPSKTPSLPAAPASSG